MLVAYTPHILTKASPRVVLYLSVESFHTSTCTIILPGFYLALRVLVRDFMSRKLNLVEYGACMALTFELLEEV